MNRFKFLLTLLLAIAFAVLFVQNREPLSLKLLCPDTASSCWYQTSPMPLALWIALFVLAGVLSSLIWQSLNSYAYARKERSRYIASEPEPNTTQFGNPTSTTTVANESIADTTTSTSSAYEIEREPETIRRSGSTYSYRFKDKNELGERPEEPENNSQKNSDDEEWI
ncbi:hypothetical protein [Myxosarcina sp. GI1]|uniref:hypothetical protein n=1 Tax=Myxosarcina sp. GI1 TaxID=1541065 RepID=UPI00055BDD74|nr:hypothetical protein [Myxosarcina sp. GI1]